MSRAGTPAAAAIFSGSFILAAAAVSRITPLAYNYLQGVALFGAIVVWMVILLSHLRFRRFHHAAELPVRMPLFPGLQVLGLAILGAVLITMGIDPAWDVSWIVGVPWLVLLSGGYFAWKRRARVQKLMEGLSPG